MKRRKSLSSASQRGNATQVVWIASIGIALLGMGLAWWLLEPPCPTTVTMATGSSRGQYFAFAQQYQKLLAEDGVELKIIETAGSVENASLLREEPGSVDLAILQGGAVPHEGEDPIASLAALYYEPLWVFHRAEATGESWDDLKRCRGRKLAIGAEGSGTRALAAMLLADNQITQGDSAGTQLLPLSGDAAATALEQGEIDAAFLVISPRSPIVRRLLNTPGISLIDFRRSAAYCKKYRYLRIVTLHEGLLDFHANLPSSDLQLLAPTASLVARHDLHPALTPLLLRAAARVHQDGGYLESPGEFPAMHRVDFPISEGARRYLQRGPSPLFRYLPFRWAAWGDRVKMMLFPLATLLIPLFKFAPPVYRWSIRSKIFRWYKVLRDVDQKLRGPENEIDYAHEIKQLEQVERELGEVTVPLSYMDEFYDLRGHVAFVREQLSARHEKATVPSRPRLHQQAA